MLVLDPAEIAAGLTSTLEAGVYDGGPIRAGLLPASGEIRAPMVAILPPALEFQATGEGWDLTDQLWTLIVWTGKGKGEPDLLEDMSFTSAALAALQTDPTLDGACGFSIPEVAERPTVEDVGNERHARRLLRRVIILRVQP